ncbi:hypothetical protein H696_00870 [Fonticula alba]|uniref:Methyltransferase type 11 domain-containing protein n=1 Tax=Fonticula alba TaxID=691883 RepID=A0A058ZG41_FONAL|nr:hypothetical protein H696_00870 [Fonticula alba]KCV73329.1 hypothetical protein H696_00870 [Fonticula alba]|eukprot:XP_009493030.1 hypothetical protein H696_00870 [Fonticula alba]
MAAAPHAARSLSTTTPTSDSGSTPYSPDLHSSASKPKLGASFRSAQIVFDRETKRLQRDRAAFHPDAEQAAYLHDHMALRSVDRIRDIMGRFEKVLDVGARFGHVARFADPEKMGSVYGVELSGEMVRRGQEMRTQRMEAAAAAAASSPPADAGADPLADLLAGGSAPAGATTATTAAASSTTAAAAAAADGDSDAEDRSTEDLIEQEDAVPYMAFVHDEEQLALCEPLHQHGPFDAAISSLSLHWTNDLVGALSQIRLALKPDAPFVGCVFGGQTLFELRTSLMLAQLDREGGMSPHISPLIDIKDLPGVLTRAGFTMTSVDIDSIVVRYPDMFALLSDLQAMGESSADVQRQPSLSKDTLIAAAAIYKEMYGEPDGSIPATFDILHMHGWSPEDPDRVAAGSSCGGGQPKPLARGSATHSLRQALSLDAPPLEGLFTPTGEETDTKGKK